MTTIILVAIGILMALGVAVMVLFYGGDAVKSASTKGEAARLLQESAQMEHSVDLFERQEGRKPGNGVSGDAAANDLVTKDYLHGLPPGAQVGGTTSPWKISYEDGMIESSLGQKYDADGKETEGWKVCVSARSMLHLPNPEAVPACSKTLPAGEPCCVRG